MSSIVVVVGMILGILGFPLFLIGLIMLLVKAIKKSSKKPALIVMLIAVLFIVVGAMSSGVDTDSLMGDNIEKAEEEVRTIIYEKYMSSMMDGNIKNISVDFTTKNADGSDYTFYGKYTVIDNYNEKYVGKFEITLAYVETYSDGSVNFKRKLVNIESAIKQ